MIQKIRELLRFLKFQRVRQASIGNWEEEEMRTIASASLQYAAQLYGDEEDLLPVIPAENSDVPTR